MAASLVHWQGGSEDPHDTTAEIIPHTRAMRIRTHGQSGDAQRHFAPAAADCEKFINKCRITLDRTPDSQLI